MNIMPTVMSSSPDVVADIPYFAPSRRPVTGRELIQFLSRRMFTTRLFGVELGGS